MTSAKIVHSHNEKSIGVQWSARTYEVVPPAFVVGIVRIHARHVVRSIECVTHQHSIAGAAVQLSVGFIRELIALYRRSAAQFESLIEARFLWRDDTN